MESIFEGFLSILLVNTRDNRVNPGYSKLLNITLSRPKNQGIARVFSKHQQYKLLPWVDLNNNWSMQTRRSPPVVSLLVVPRRHFCFG